jgi:predicted NBD/HSP70 family sugar kinase
LDTQRKTGRTAPQIGEHNLRVTLEAIRRDGPLTRLELGRRSGLSAPGISNILRRLREDGLITDRKRSEPGSGQPSSEFAVNPEGAFGIGLRLDGGAGEAVLIDLAGAVRRRGLFALDGDDATETIAAAVRPMIEGEVPAGRLLGVGIGTPAPEALALDRLADALAPVGVQAERDCVAALLAERTFGIGVVEGGVMLIVLSDTVRAGFLFRGVPFGGVHGRAGSIGAMRTGVDHVPLDTVASLDVLRGVMTPVESALLASGAEVPPSPAIRQWLRAAAAHLLDAIVATAGFLAPGAILIGGDLPRGLINALIAQMSVERGDTAIRPFITPWISPIRPTTFPGAGIAIGAALLPFFETLLPSPLATS